MHGGELLHREGVLYREVIGLSFGLRLDVLGDGLGLGLGLLLGDEEVGPRGVGCARVGEALIVEDKFFVFAAAESCVDEAVGAAAAPAGRGSLF
jgi:hypothetical protein